MMAAPVVVGAGAGVAAFGRRARGRRRPWTGPGLWTDLEVSLARMDGFGLVQRLPERLPQPRRGVPDQVRFGAGVLVARSVVAAGVCGLALDV